VPLSITWPSITLANNAAHYPHSPFSRDFFHQYNLTVPP
jgi:hypothetical protein